MPVLFVLFCLLPFLAGLVAEYLACRFARKKFWRLAPPAAGVILAFLIGVGRYRVWSSQESPLSQLLLFPGLPAVFLLFGIFWGYRIYRRLWSPRVINEKKQRGRDV